MDLRYFVRSLEKCSQAFTVTRKDFSPWMPLRHQVCQLTRWLDLQTLRETYLLPVHCSTHSTRIDVVTGAECPLAIASYASLGGSPGPIAREELHCGAAHEAIAEQEVDAVVTRPELSRGSQWWSAVFQHDGRLWRAVTKNDSY